MKSNIGVEVNPPLIETIVNSGSITISEPGIYYATISYAGVNDVSSYSYGVSTISEDSASGRTGCFSTIISAYKYTDSGYMFISITSIGKSGCDIMTSSSSSQTIYFSRNGATGSYPTNIRVYRVV